MKQKNFDQLPCYQPWHKIVIRPNGKTYPCCNFYEQKSDNIRDKSLKDIWYRGRFDIIRNDIRLGNLGPDCKNCTVWIINQNRGLKIDLKKNQFVSSIKNRFKELVKRLSETDLFSKTLNNFYFWFK